MNIKNTTESFGLLTKLFHWLIAISPTNLANSVAFPLYVKTGTEMLADSCQNSLQLLQISLQTGVMRHG